MFSHATLVPWVNNTLASRPCTVRRCSANRRCASATLCPIRTALFVRDLTRPLTSAERERICDLYREGKNLGQVARATHLGKERVSEVIRDAGLTRSRARTSSARAEGSHISARTSSARAEGSHISARTSSARGEGSHISARTRSARAAGLSGAGIEQSQDAPVAEASSTIVYDHSCRRQLNTDHCTATEN